MNSGSKDEQLAGRPVRSGPGPVLLGTVQLYLEGSVMAVVMATLGGVFGLVTLVLSGDQRLALAMATTAFMLAGIVLTVRLWRMTRPPPAEPPA